MVECKCDVAVDTINKILTVCVAILVVADSIISIITLGSFKISVFVMAIYYLFFALVLVCAEFKLKFVLTRFHLLELSFGKFIYSLLYLCCKRRFGLIMLDTSGLQLACAIVLVVFGFYHLVLACVMKKKPEEDAPPVGPQVQAGKEDLSDRQAPLNP